MVTMHDLETDFDAAIKAMVDEAIKEVEGMSDEERAEHYLAKSIEHLVRLHEFDAPDFLIRSAYRRQRKHLNALRERVRSQRG